MNASEPKGPESHSRDSVIVIADGPVDNEIRPCRPERLAFLKAESEKLKRYLAMQKEREEKERLAKEQEPPRPDA